MFMINSLLGQGLKELGLNVSQGILENFSVYLKELQEWNKKTNLTAIDTEDEIIKKHFLDSLALLFYTKDLSGKIVIDIGTGAGFPGIPIKIVFPDLRITLLDSSTKKIEFLKHITKILKLDDVSILHGRAEELAKTEHREKYDIVLARAVSELPVLIEICLPFVKIGGIFVAYKSDFEEEIKKSNKVLDIIGGKLQQVKNVEIPFLEAKRNLVIISKERMTPKEYPRKAGIPQKRPIY